jgi:hypothetical protein
MNLLLIYVIIFLIILLILNSYLSPIVVKEYFAQNDSLPLTVFNGMGRNIVFPYYGNRNILTASQRALIDGTLIKSTPNGNCMLTSLNSQLNPSFAIVHEDSLFYTLKKSCIALNLQGYEMKNNGNTILMWFSNKTILDKENFAKFILVNPLFVEFSINGKLSSAYTVSTGNYLYSTSTDIKNYNQYRRCIDNECIALRFDRTVNPNVTCSQNDAFNYKEYSPSQKLLTNNDLMSIQGNIFLKDGLINMWVYYLDDVNTDFQSTGRSLFITNQRATRILIFDVEYKRHLNDPQKINMYEFMNNIALMYYNFIIPVFTVSFDVSITSDMFNNKYIRGNGQHDLIVCKMLNGYGGNRGCQNNIFSVRLYINSTNSKFYRLMLGSGDGQYGCGEHVKKSPPSWINIPWLSPNNNVRITATFGPNQKHVLATWIDINKGDLGRQMVYTKSIQNYKEPIEDPCGYNTWDKTDANNVVRLFASKNLNPRPELKNIELTTNDKFVKSVNKFTLGYVNLIRYNN